MGKGKELDLTNDSAHASVKASVEQSGVDRWCFGGSAWHAMAKLHYVSTPNVSLNQKQQLKINIFKAFSEHANYSLPSTASKNTTKKIGRRARKREIDAGTCANHARYSSVDVTFCGSWKNSLYLEKTSRRQSREHKKNNKKDRSPCSQKRNLCLYLC